MRNFEIIKISDIVAFGNEMRAILKTNLNWSTQLRNSVVLHPAKKSASGISIKLEVGGTGVDKSGNSLVGMARAYEYGSGIHGKRKKKYRIEAKNKPYLKFFWTRKNTEFRGLSVMHPGVEPREYMKKSFDETMAKSAPDLAFKIRNNVKRELAMLIKEINSNVK